MKIHRHNFPRLVGAGRWKLFIGRCTKCTQGMQIINIKFLFFNPFFYQLAIALAEAIFDLINHGLDGNKLHIVGHSLGGQMAGMIGRKIKEKSNNTIKLRRISALDPAFPPFYPGWIYKPLGKHDADFVRTNN